MKILEYIMDNWVPEMIWYRLSSKGNEVTNIQKWLEANVGTTVLKNIVDRNGWDKITDPDKLIIKILKWVALRTTYTTDKVQYKTVEYWATPAQTLESKEGDCEDGASLIFCLARTAGISKDQVQLVAGNVEGGGHSWVRYVSKKFPYVSYFIDWCYWYDSNSIHSRVAYFDYKNDIKGGNQKYLNYWFLATDKKAMKRFDW